MIPIKFESNFNAALAQLLDAPVGSREVKELPLWLVKPLVTVGLARTSTPIIFNKKTLAKIKASASNQLLGNLSPYYYEVGCEVTELVGEVEITAALTAAYAQRYRDILGRFGNTEDRGAGKFKNCLTHAEQRCKCFPALIPLLFFPLIFGCLSQCTNWDISWSSTREPGVQGSWKQFYLLTLPM
jgi:hypothetical protein